MSHKRFAILSTSAILLLALACPAHADGVGSQFGLLYGFSVPDNANTDPYHIFGVKGAAFVVPSFQHRRMLLVSDSRGANPPAKKFHYSLHGVEAAYHMPNGTGDSFVAFRVGITKLHENPSSTDVVFSPYHYGVACGYDYYFRPWLAIGFEGSYVHVENSKVIDSGTLYEENSFNVINFLVSLQVRL